LKADVNWNVDVSNLEVNLMEDSNEVSFWMALGLVTTSELETVVGKAVLIQLENREESNGGAEV
jgi:hypothetical protein